MTNVWCIEDGCGVYVMMGFLNDRFRASRTFDKRRSNGNSV